MYKIGDVVQFKGKEWTIGYIVIGPDEISYSLDPIGIITFSSTFVEEEELERDNTKLAQLL